MKTTGTAKLKQANKSTKVAPVTQEERPLPAPLDVPKRGPGRPRKELQPGAVPDLKNDPKALVMFRKMIADAEKVNMTTPDFDGGGTREDSPIISKESLQRRVARRLNVLDRYLTDDKLLELLAMSGLKEVGIYEGIMMDKSLVLQGQPNVIIGNDDRGALNNTLPRVLAELKKRGMITTVKERSIEFKGTE